MLPKKFDRSSSKHHITQHRTRMPCKSPTDRFLFPAKGTSQRQESPRRCLFRLLAPGYVGHVIVHWSRNSHACEFVQPSSQVWAIADTVHLTVQLLSHILEVQVLWLFPCPVTPETVSGLNIHLKHEQAWDNTNRVLRSRRKSKNAPVWNWRMTLRCCCSSLLSSSWPWCHPKTRKTTSPASPILPLSGFDSKGSLCNAWSKASAPKHQR